MIKENNTENTSNNKGSVLIITIIISTVLFSVGTIFLSIINKEIDRQLYSKRSHEAFSIADSAWECVLYNDLHNASFALRGEAVGRFFCNKPGISKKQTLIACHINNVTKKYNQPKRFSISDIQANPIKHTFIITQDNQDSCENLEGSPCAEVVVRKRCIKESDGSCNIVSGSIETRIEVIGYDRCKVGSSNTFIRGDIRRFLQARY